MAVLSDNDRAAVWAEFMRLGDQTGPVTGCLKADIRAAVNGLDDYFNSNAIQINNAVPQPARGNLTTAQKALLGQLVLYKRYIAGA